jgi:L-ascorbate metabolism protein UlaG (beta-lactamase superfamily)
MRQLAGVLVLAVVAGGGCQRAAEAPMTGEAPAAAEPATGRDADRFDTPQGALQVTPVYHGSLMLTLGGRIVHVDPWSSGDYTALPEADLVLITDVHGDHMDPEALEAVSKDGTVVVAPPAVAETITQAQVLRNEETTEIDGIRLEAVPMYNLERGPEEGRLYHDKGRGNGYIVTWADQRIYISGDTECIPEMRDLEHIDIAFVTMNLPFTMTPQEAAECVRAFRPRVVYPYHYRGQNPEEFRDALADVAGVDVRLRDWYPE